MIRAVLWDFGGVLTTSPFEAFRRFEREQGLPEDFIRGVNARNPDQNAWARFERGALGFGEFDRAFLEETSALGHPVRGADVLALLGGDLRPAMVEALRRCKDRLRTACLTNNFRGSGERSETSPMAPVLALFDVVIESSVVGVRKPDRRFYEHALGALELEGKECVFLDDLGINLKPARALGMHTIKVVSADQALGELEPLVGFPLRDPSP